MKKKEHESRSRLWRLLFMLFALNLGINAYAQNTTITGTVIDTSGEPIIGASVVVKSTKNGVITDINGNFSIKCTKGTTLRFSYIGYKDVEKVVLGTNKMKVTMEEDAQTLEEVVVVGYGTVAKRDVTGSIATVDSKRIEERQPTDIFEALQGEVPGLMVTNNSGAPGEPGTMSIRGVASMSSGGVSPLYIVDGVAVDDISSINPQDIKSMEVLKDAASASIYGSRSAAGVIIITTKRGAEGKPQINIKYSHTIQKMGHKVDQANAFERYLYEQKTSAGTSLNKTSADSLNPTNMADNNMQDLITRVAHTNDVSVNVSGSYKNKASYFTSIGFLDQQGIVLNSWFKRFNVRTNIDYSLNSKLKVSTNVELSYTARNSVDENVVLLQGLRRPAHMALYYPDGSYIYYNAGQRNPVAQLDEAQNEQNGYSVRFTEQAEYKFLKNFAWFGQATVRYNVDRTDYLNTANLTNGVSEGRNIVNLKRYLSGETYFSWNAKYKKHNPYATAGASIEDWRTEGFNIYGKDHVSESIITSNAFQELSLDKTQSAYSSNAMVGFFARAGYSYASRYIVNASVRLDGSSRFVGSRWGFFPSVSASWRISDEKFMKWSKKILTDAKLRYSWGMTGVQSIGNYEAINTYVINKYYNGISAVYQNSRLANVNLSWEASGMNNLGLDLSFLNGRFNVVAEWYRKSTKDLLAMEQIPSEMGVSNMRVNLGSIENEGVEFTVNGYPIRNRNFSWQTGFNISFNKNKILKLEGGAAYLEGGRYWIEEDGPIGQWYGYKSLGIYPTDDANAYALTKGTDGKDVFGDRLTPVYERDPNNYNNYIYGSNGKPVFSHYETKDGQKYEGEIGKVKAVNTLAKGGDVIWEDVNHDGIIGDADRQVLGNAIPTTYYGWQNSFNYKEFTLSFSFYGSLGNKVYNQMRRNLNQYSSSNYTSLASDCRNIWKYQGQYTNLYAGSNATQGVNNGRELSSFYLEDGDFIRLDNVRLTYRLNKRLAAKFMARELSVYVYGKNLAMWTNYSGFDPSNISNSNPLQPGTDNGRYPRSKEFGFGMNLNF